MRVDKFLKVSRILKRRSLAAEAAKSGKISVNGRQAKPATFLKVGDVVEIRFGNGAVMFKVEALKETVKKDDAASLYTVLSESSSAGERVSGSPVSDRSDASPAV